MISHPRLCPRRKHLPHQFTIVKIAVAVINQGCGYAAVKLDFHRLARPTLPKPTRPILIEALRRYAPSTKDAVPYVPIVRAVPGDERLPRATSKRGGVGTIGTTGTFGTLV
jgi:hypothetical protein